MTPMNADGETGRLEYTDETWKPIAKLADELQEKFEYTDYDHEEEAYSVTNWTALAERIMAAGALSHEAVRQLTSAQEALRWERNLRADEGKVLEEVSAELRALRQGEPDYGTYQMELKAKLAAAQEALRISQGDAAILRGLFVRFRALEGTNDRAAMRLLLKDMDTYLSATRTPS